jgi:signal transduction histidine kinase
LFRIFQEIITNIQKHANTKEIIIKLKINKAYVLLIIEDFGDGFDVEK